MREEPDTAKIPIGQRFHLRVATQLSVYRPGDDFSTSYGILDRASRVCGLKAGPVDLIDQDVAVRCGSSILALPYRCLLPFCSSGLTADEDRIGAKQGTEQGKDEERIRNRSLSFRLDSRDPVIILMPPNT